MTLRLAVPFATLCLLASSTSVLGQDALGAGDRLDANLQSGSGGRNQQKQVENYANRNLVVTGDVAGGREFRGSVGYTMPGAFSEALGSDAYFLGTRGAYNSSFPYLDNVGTSGRFVPSGVYGEVPYFRPSTPPPGRANFLQTGPVPEFRSRAPISSDTLIPGDLLRLDTSSSQISGTVRTPEYGTRFMIGSSLTGVKDLSREQAMWADSSLYDRVAYRASLEERAAAEQAAPPRPGMVTDARVDASIGAGSLNEASRIDSAQPTGLVELTGGGPDFDAIVNRMVELYRSMPNVRLEADPEIMRRVREALGDALQPPADMGPQGPGIRENYAEIERAAKEAAESGGTSSSPPANETTTPKEPLDSNDPDAANQRDQPRVLTIDELATLLSHNRQIDDFSPDERRRLDRMIADGETALEAGQFFQAETIFNRVLQFASDHPFATAGRVNAQIGAGLYGEAAHNLRALLINQPELIDARFSPRLLPSVDRLDTAVATIRERLKGPNAADYGLLLAYIGHQIGEPEKVRQGLAAVAGTPQEDTLRELLERIWLRSPQSQGASDAPIPPAAPPANAPVTTPGG